MNKLTRENILLRKKYLDILTFIYSYTNDGKKVRFKHLSAVFIRSKRYILKVKKDLNYPEEIKKQLKKDFNGLRKDNFITNDAFYKIKKIIENDDTNIYFRLFKPVFSYPQQLTKSLNILIKLKIIEKKSDPEGGYPYYILTRQGKNLISRFLIKKIVDELPDRVIEQNLYMEFLKLTKQIKNNIFKEEIVQLIKNNKYEIINPNPT
ncbi:MAG: hypothetical protein QXS02_04800 [Candidatus Thermoplasmatota archaeon]